MFQGKVRKLVLLGFLLLLGSRAQAGDPCAIVVGPQAPQLERKAGLELQRYFERLFGFRPPLLTSAGTKADALVLLGNPETNPIVKAATLGAWPRLSEQGFLLRKAKLENRPVLIVGGGSPLATLWAAYDLLEKYGVRYMLYGDVIPEQQQRFWLPEVENQHEPNIPFRCWRIWNVHAFGPESWGIEEQRRVIDQLVKMKFNAVFIALWPHQPFVHYEFRGVKKVRGDIFWGWKYPIDCDFIGSEKFGGASEFMNPDFVGARNYEQRLAAGSRLMHGILNYAHSRGMKTILGFELLHFPQEFKEQFKNWLPEGVDRRAEDEISFIYEGLYTLGPDREGAPFLNADNPVLMELVETVLKAHIDAYPEADYYALLTSELRSSVAGYERIWKILDKKYNLEAIEPLSRILEKANRRGLGWRPGQGQKEVKGDIEFLYFLDNLINQRKALQRTRKPNAKLIVYQLAPELYRVLPLLLPKNAGYLSVVDYTMSLVARRIDSLAGLKNLWSLQIVTLQDDNVGVLLQMPGRSTASVMKALQQHGIEGYVVRFWMLGDVDPSANFLARVSWEKDLTLEQAYRDLLVAVCGEPAANEAFRAFIKLEETTLSMEMDETTLGLGFPVPDLLRRQFEAETVAPPIVDKSSHNYDATIPSLRKAHKLATKNGARFLDYFLGRVEFSAGYLRLVKKVRELGVAYKGWKALRSRGEVALAIRKQDEVMDLAIEVEGLAQSVVRTFSDVTRDQSDRGALASMNRYVWQYVRSLRVMLEFELAFWRLGQAK